MKTRHIIIGLSVLCLFVASSHAGQVSYSPLTDVVKQAQWIFRAKVLTVERKDTPKETRVEYLVAPSQVLMGLPAIPAKVRLSYAEVIPIIRNEDGKVVGWFSPIFSGSGKEFSIKADQEWLFLLVANKLSEEKVTGILRAEPITMENEIKEMLSQPKN